MITSSPSISRGRRGAPRALLVPALLVGAPLMAQEAASLGGTPPAAGGAEAAAPEQLIVVGQRVYPVVDTVAPSTHNEVDTAELLKRLPGANLSANGPLTGIAQYRGLYGDRVAISLDGLGSISGGPNAMDAPLSYASPLLLDRLSLERGIASVSSAVESLGGHVAVEFDRGRHGEGREVSAAGKAQARYASNGRLSSFAAQLVGANDAHKVAFLGERDRSADLDYPGGKLTPTRMERDRYDLSYAYQRGDLAALVHGGRLETLDTGTPSLPMDIRSIETDLLGLHVETELGRTVLDVGVGYADVDHVMDNFALRTPPATPAQHRSTQALARGWHFRIAGRTVLPSGEWRVGLDGQSAEHSAVITNPNAAAFRIANFNAAERDIVGVYAQWNRPLGRLDVEAGVRANRVRTDSGPVSAVIPAASPMAQMMAMDAAMLASVFNARDLARARTNVDAVLKIGRAIGEMRSVYVELGRKTRAPSYQELYLWLPLESTGGLADGRSYLGNPELDSEVSREINVGSSWHFGRTWIAPQIFYKDISGYIQGVPSRQPVANRVAAMMTGSPALEFSNTDAKLYGIDVSWGGYVSERLLLDGMLSYVRGRRTDVEDDLYRVAPLNGRIALTYEAPRWTAGIEAIASARQDEVSAYNGERETPGFGLVNLSADWRMQPNLLLHAGIANLLDARYRDHLDGINRVAGVALPVGERLYGPGRSVQIGVRFDW